MQEAWRKELPAFPAGFAEAYELLGLLGEGGMGRVYLARQRHLDREVAVKVLKSLGEADTVRFAREAQILAGMSHPRVVRVFDSATGNGVSWLAMERVTCETLERRMRRTPLTLRESLRVCARVADALGYAHAEGVVHRDVKPDNVFLTDDLDVKLADFGLAREVLGAQITASGTMMGTPEYMSPEQVEAKAVGPASDQYSLGVVLYRLITQLYPFTGENPLTIAMARLRTPPPPPRQHCAALPAAVDALVVRMLAVRPPDRHATMDDVRVELERLADDLGPEGDRVYRPPVRSTRGVKALPLSERQEPGAADPPRGAPTAALARVPRTAPWIFAGVVLILASFAGAWRWGASRGPGVVALADPEPAGAQVAARRLQAALSRLDPLARIEDLRRIERELRHSRLAPEQRDTFLRPRWSAEFDPRLDEAAVPAAWSAFAPLEREYFATAADARERLAMANALEDFSFLALGLARLHLPLRFAPSPATETARGVATQPTVRMTAAAGFRLARRTRGAPLRLTPHPDGGVLTRLDPVTRYGDREIDDHFFATAIALGAGNELASAFDSIIKVDAKRGGSNQVEYAHPVPIELPPRLEAAAVSAFVSDLNPEQRFDVYADPSPAGFTRRVATFRAAVPGPTQVWQMLDPVVLNDRIYLKVKFRILPGQSNYLDHAELHQLTLHWRARDP